MNDLIKHEGQKKSIVILGDHILQSRSHSIASNIYIYIYVCVCVLGSKTLGTKCIRTSFCICWQIMIKTMSLGLGLSKIYLL